MARMRTRLKKDTHIRVVAMPTYADADTLEGLTVPVDPNLIYRLPRLYRPGDIALMVCFIGLLLLGRETCPAEMLSRLCGIPRRDLRVALARVQGRTGAGAPKYFTAELRGQEVSISAVQTRLTRPDQYVRLPVETLASAPSSAHARYYVLAAEAAVGDEQRGRNEVSRPLAALELTNAQQLDDAHRWVVPLLSRSLGRSINYQLDGEEVVLTSLNSCHWNYDHRAAPRPWTDETFWKRTMLRARDGVWQGHDLSVDPLRAAKVCDWVNKHGCKLGARDLRIHWLLALQQALINDGCPEDDHSILADITEHGATVAFERWVIAAADQDLEPANFKQEDLAEEYRVMRLIAAKDPRDRRLRPYAVHPLSGESMCQYQFWRRVLKPLKRQRETGGMSLNDYRYAIREQLCQYSVDGRTPHRLKFEHQPAVISHNTLQQIAVKAMIAPYPAHYQPAVELVVSMVTQGLRRGVRTMDEAIEGMQDDARRSGNYQRIVTAWRLAVSGVKEDGVTPGVEYLEAMAARIFREGLADVEAHPDAAEKAHQGNVPPSSGT
jgi:hypothetical protein